MGALDCIIGEKCRAVTRAYRTEHSRVWAVTRAVRIPCEVLILDQYIHEDLFGPIEPQVHIHSDLFENVSLRPVTMRPEDRLPMLEQVRPLGKGLAGIRTPDLPRYVEMASHVFDQLGWDEAKFSVYRARLEYPPLPTTVVMEHPLPEPGE